MDSRYRKRIYNVFLFCNFRFSSFHDEFSSSLNAEDNKVVVSYLFFSLLPISVRVFVLSFIFSRNCLGINLLLRGESTRVSGQAASSLFPNDLVGLAANIEPHTARAI